MRRTCYFAYRTSSPCAALTAFHRLQRTRRLQRGQATSGPKRVKQPAGDVLSTSPGARRGALSETFSFGGEYQPKPLNGRVCTRRSTPPSERPPPPEIDDSGAISGDENIWLRVNGPDADILAWENNLNWQWSRQLRLDAGLSYIHARYDEAIDRVTGLSTDEFLKRPEWTGHIGLSYENHELFDAHALLSYTGEMLAVGEDADIWRRTDPFYEVDLGISKDFDGILGAEHLTLSLGIENLFDERQDDLQDNGEDRDPTYLYGPTNPRTYYVRVSGTW